MSPKSKYKLRLCIEFLFWLLALGVFLICSTRWTSAKILDPKEGVHEIAFPYKFSNRVGETFEYQIEARKFPWSSSLVHITPDDCLDEIRVNGQNVEIPNAIDHCDYSHGFNLNLGSSFRTGINQIYLRVSDRGGDQGLDVQFMNLSLTQIIYAWALIVWLLTLSWRTWRSIAMPKIPLFFICGALLLHVLVFTYTSPYDRTYDVGGHIDFIQWIWEKHSLPKPEDCWQCYHLPTYYVLGSVVYGLVLTFDPAAALKAAQAYSFALYLIFLFSSAMALSEVLRNKRTWSWVVVLLSFWPSAFIHSLRIGNDLGFYAAAGLGLWATLRSWNRPTMLNWTFVSLTAILAQSMKSTGILFCFFAVMTALLSLFKHRRMQLRSWILPIVVLIIGLSSLQIWNLSRTCVDGVCRPMVSNANSLHSQLHLGSDLSSYYELGVQEYLASPFADPWHDRSGRQHFFCYALKTSLFGEFTEIGNRYSEIPAKFLSYWVFVLIGFSIFGIIVAWRKGIILLGFMAIFGIGLMIFRYQYPWSCSEDFRYIYPFIVGFLGLSGLGIQNFIEKVQAAKARVSPWIWPGLVVPWVLGTLILFLCPLFTKVPDLIPQPESMFGNRMALWHLVPTQIQQDWASPYDNANLDGHALTIGTVKCKDGLGVHARSMVNYLIPRGAHCFATKVGMDNFEFGQAFFVIKVGGIERWRSPVMRHGDLPVSVKLPLDFSNNVELIVDPDGPNTGDHSDWCEAAFYKSCSDVPF